MLLRSNKLGSDNECYVNENKALSGCQTSIKQPASQGLEVPKICASCGEIYPAPDGRSRYCGRACADAAKRGHLRRRQAAHRSAHPLREYARQALKNAVVLGKVRRPTRCERCCAVTVPEAHHSDYERPFFVEWLCRACHAGLEGGRHFGAGESKPD